MKHLVPPWVQVIADPVRPSFLRGQRRRRRWRAAERAARDLVGAGYLVIGLVAVGLAGAVWGVRVALKDFWRDR